MRYAKDLQPGDLVGVAYTNHIRHAVWIGTGRYGNPQFLLLPWYQADVQNWETNRRVARIKEGKKFYVDYIVRKNEHSIVKIDPVNLPDEDRTAYMGIVNLLKEKGIIK